MRILIRDPNASPELSVRRALDILLEAGIYSSADGGGTINDRALILVNAVHVPEAIVALNKAGMQVVVG